MLEHMLHVLVGLGQQVGNPNGCGQPNEPGVGHLHLVGPVEEVEWGDPDKAGNPVEHKLALLGDGGGEVLSFFFFWIFDNL